MYDSYEYANERLAGTVCRLNNGEPILVHAVRPGLCVSFSTLEREELYTTLDNIDVSSPPLGFLQRGKEAVYIARVPKRRDWKQGLRAGNVGYVAGDKIDCAVSSSDIMLAIRGVYCTNLVDGMCVLSDKKYKSLALNRHWAITNNGLIKYKWDVVGTYTPDGEFTFYPQFSYIESRFYEDVVNADSQTVATRKKAG